MWTFGYILLWDCYFLFESVFLKSMPHCYCEKHLNFPLLSWVNVRTIELKRSEQKHVASAFQYEITQLHCIQNEIVQTFCTARNSQHFCAPNLEATKFPIILFSPSSPKPQNFWFSASSGNMSQSSVCKASSSRWHVKDPLPILPGDWLSPDSPLINCLAGAHPVPSYTNKYSDRDGG